MSVYDPTPIGLTDGNLAMLEGPQRALAAVGLDLASDETACVDYLVDRAEMPRELAGRVVDALQRMAAA